MRMRGHVLAGFLCCDVFWICSKYWLCK